MDIKNLTDLTPATLATLAKVAGEAAKATRGDLEPGEYAVNGVLTLVLDAELRVLEDHEANMPQKAKPWGIIALLLEQLNVYREAAGLAGLTLETLVEMAEKVDPKLQKKAEKAANAHIKALKEPTKSPRKGKVEVMEGGIKLPEGNL